MKIIDLSGGSKKIPSMPMNECTMQYHMKYQYELYGIRGPKDPKDAILYFKYNKENILKALLHLNEGYNPEDYVNKLEKIFHSKYRLSLSNNYENLRRKGLVKKSYIVDSFRLKDLLRLFYIYAPPKESLSRVYGSLSSKAPKSYCVLTPYLFLYLVSNNILNFSLGSSFEMFYALHRWALTNIGGHL